jgi:hypothetical protein
MKDGILIYMQQVKIKLDVVMPKSVVGDFMVEFGKAFAYEDVYYGMMDRKIDGYDPRSDEWHVFVTVDIEDKDKLLLFIENFSKNHSLSFRNAD